MEHGKFSVSKIWHIAKMEYIKLIMDPRMILIVAALVFAYQFITVPLLQNAAMMGKPINVYEPFVALLNSNFMILLVPAVFLAIMSDYPRIDGNTLFVVQRAGKGNWFFGQILYAQMSIHCVCGNDDSCFVGWKFFCKMESCGFGVCLFVSGLCTKYRKCQHSAGNLLSYVAGICCFLRGVICLFVFVFA